MKKIISFILVFAFLFACASHSVLALGSDNEIGSQRSNIDKRLEGAFLSDTFTTEGMDIQNLTGDFLSLSVKGSEPTVSFECSLEQGEVKSNKIMIVLENQTKCKSLDIKMKYKLGAEERWATEKLDIETTAGKKNYYLDYDYAAYMTEIKITFSGISQGNIKLYSLLRKYGYKDTSDYIYEENSRVQAVFDSESYNVSVSGTIGHSTVAKYSGAQIELHRIGIDNDASVVLSDQSGLIDTKPISIQFNFSVKVNSLSEVYSQYVLVISSADGERELLTTPIVPGSGKKSDTQREKNDVFKGIASSITVDAIGVNPSLAVVDVQVDLLKNKSGNGDYFLVDRTPYYFDREYISRLDKQIKAYTDTNCKVYLTFQFQIVDNSGIGENFWKDLYACSLYLLQRYNGGEYGDISGIIVGDRVDRFDASSNASINAHLKFYSMYLYIVSEAVCSQKNDVRIFVPVSDVAYSKTEDANGYESEQFLRSLSWIMESMYSTSCEFSVALCGERVPEVFLERAENESYVYYTAERIKDFERMLTAISEEGSVVSRDYIFIWSPSEDLSGGMISATYVYNYLKLLFGSYAESFIVSFDRAERLSDLKHVIKYIDTPNFSSATEHALEVIGIGSWKDLIINFDPSKIDDFRLLERGAEDVSGVNILGSYDIWKFSEQNGAAGWYSLNGSSSLSINLSSEFGRCLVAKLLPHNEVMGEYSSIMYAFDEPKEVSFADYIVYSLGIGSESETNAIFELKFVIGSEKEIIEATKIVKKPF